MGILDPATKFKRNNNLKEIKFKRNNNDLSEWFTPIYSKTEEKNTVSVNAGTEDLSISGGGVNRAFQEQFKKLVDGQLLIDQLQNLHVQFNKNFNSKENKKKKNDIIKINKSKFKNGDHNLIKDLEGMYYARPNTVKEKRKQDTTSNNGKKRWYYIFRYV